jgi:hypothetical protein
MDKVDVLIRVEETETPGEYRLTVFADGERQLVLMPREVMFQIPVNKLGVQNLGMVQMVYEKGNEKAAAEAAMAIAKAEPAPPTGPPLACNCPSCRALRTMRN